MFPPIPLTWADDTNYAAGADPWSGTPTKVEPTSQTRTKGFIPESPASAQQANYLLNKLAIATNILVAQICSNWDVVRDFPATVTTTVALFEFSRPFYDFRRKQWIHPGITTGSGWYSRDFGHTWTDLVAGTGGPLNGGGANNDAASASYGDLLMGYRGGSATLRRYNYGTSTWGNVAHNNAATGCSWMAHDDANDTWIYLGIGGGSVFGCSNAPDSTYVFTSRVLAGTPVGTATRDIGKPVISPGGICIFQSEANSFNRSTDGGSTWTLVTPASPPANEHAYCWIPDRSEFVMGAADGKIYASVDGVTWTERAATSIFAGLGFSISSMEAFGSVVWCTYDHATLNGGLGFSLDGGATWQLCGPGGTSRATDAGGAGMLTVGEDAVMAFGMLGVANDNLRGFTFLKGLRRNALGAIP